MDYKKKKISELKVIAEELGLEFGSMAKKNELVNILEKHAKAIRLEKEKAVKEEKKIANLELESDVSNLNPDLYGEKFDAKEAKKVEKIAKEFFKKTGC